MSLSLYRLPDSVVRFEGNVTAFLNGITSNSLQAPLNAFLNQHGRIIATVRQRRISETVFCVALAFVALEPLFKHLERYLKLSRVAMHATGESVFICADTAEILWSCPPDAVILGTETFDLFRLEHQIPLMGVDYHADEFILNVDAHAYVAYTKGCFLGQEPVAKVHNRSQPTRALRVMYRDQCTPQQAAGMSSMVVDPINGRVKGFVFVPTRGAM